jgi:hypothetical protein
MTTTSWPHAVALWPPRVQKAAPVTGFHPSRLARWVLLAHIAEPGLPERPSALRQRCMVELRATRE